MSRTDPIDFKVPPGIPAAALIHERELFKADPIGLIKGGYLRIKTKDASGNEELAPFMPNSSQLRTLDIIQSQRRAKQPIRIVVLKSRQMGTSTLAQSLLYSFCSMRGNLNGFVIADDEDGASLLFGMNEIFWEWMNKNHRHMCPRKKNSSEKKMVFSNKRSGIYVETANNRRAGRKYTLHHVHVSEAAFFKSFKETMRGMMQAVPDKPETIVIVESTANGTNDFCKFWRRVERDHKEGTTQWIPVFLSWKDHEEYRRGFRSDYEKQMFESALTGKEIELRKEFGLTLEQLHWRRWKLSNDFAGDEEGFEVEFPLSPDQAFKSTSKSVFPEKVIKAHRSKLCPPRMIGDLEMDDRRSFFMPSKDGRLKVFDIPKTGHKYVIGIDSCEPATGNDYAAMEVIDRTTWTQVASYHGKVPPEVLGEHAVALGLYYKMAMLAPEINGPGFSTLAKIMQMGYPNVCRRMKTVIDEKNMQIVETEEMGFRTDAKSKQIMIRETAEGLRNLLFVVKNELTLDEASTYVVQEVTEGGNLKYGADDGYHDDDLMAFMIAQHYARQLPDYESEEKQEMPQISRITGYG